VPAHDGFDKPQDQQTYPQPLRPVSKVQLAHRETGFDIRHGPDQLVAE
jgi:hypothetical protein